MAFHARLALKAADHADCLNAYVLVFLGLRIIYALAYVFARTQKWSYLRTASWMLSIVSSLGIIYQAAAKLSDRVVMSI